MAGASGFRARCPAGRAVGAGARTRTERLANPRGDRRREAAQRPQKHLCTSEPMLLRAKVDGGI
jgi:hypothetical protein